MYYHEILQYRYAYIYLKKKPTKPKQKKIPKKQFERGELSTFAALSYQIGKIMFTVKKVAPPEFSGNESIYR